MTNTLIGMHQTYGGKENAMPKIFKTAKENADHADYWYNILPEDHKEKAFCQVITWDTKKSMVNGKM